MEMSLKNLLLAGIGSMAYSMEKSEELVNQLVAKGELTMNQGRELNEELRRKVKNKTDEARTDVGELVKKAVAGLNLATKQDLDDLRARVEKLEQEGPSGR